MRIRRKQLMGIFLSAALAAGSILVPVSAKRKDRCHRSAESKKQNRV